jgi:hypothetical protein
MAIHEATRAKTLAERVEAAQGQDRSARRRLLHLTDGAIARLEELNLEDRGACRPDQETVERIDAILTTLPLDIRRRFGGRETVQQALDSFFDVQEEIMLPWQRAQWLSPLDAA